MVLVLLPASALMAARVALMLIVGAVVSILWLALSAVVLA